MVSSRFAQATPYLVLLIFIATIGPFQFGFHLGELNASEAAITCQDFMVLPTSTAQGLPRCIPMSPDEFGLVSSIYNLGGLAGALIAGPIATNRGRVYAMRATTLIFMLGGATATLAPNVMTMVFGRFLSGVAAGATLVVSPIYVAEISPAELRGFFGAFTQVMVSFGIFTAQVLGYFFGHDGMWRVILASAGLLGALDLLALCFIPESPRWLSKRARIDEAEITLKNIRAANTDVSAELLSWSLTDSVPEEEPLLGQSQLKSKHSSSSVSVLDVINSPTYRPAIVAVMITMAAQQLTGINCFNMYSSSILSSIMPSSAKLVTVIMFAINILASIVFAPLPDMIGRKPCLLVSISGMGTSCVCLALGLGLRIKLLSVMSVFLVVVSFSIGLAPVPLILASELVDSEAVGAIQSLALVASWSSNFLVAQFFPTLNTALHGQGRVFWIFAAISLILGLLIAWKVPETRVKHVEAEIDE